MIPVVKQKEPDNFDKDVRQRGLKYLNQNPRPNAKDFSRHGYWTKVNADIYRLYRGICAYTGDRPIF
ncbi:MAG: hypothetical protein LBU17_09920 [Treponema sp.]|jgi:hypothetical protein|nr:hypothetical protein [Treponema sp.]